MSKTELEEHKERMLLFCKERNLAIDDIINRIERFIDVRKGGVRTPRHCEHLLIEALGAIKKLTGK